jgi:hypothetical protein
MWLRAKDEREEAARQRKEAARQAKIATDSAKSAANALTEIAALQKQRDQRQRSLQAVQERDPWLLPSPDDPETDLFNDTDTPKYDVNVKVFVTDQLWQEKTIPFVGPRRPARIPWLTVGNGPTRVEITWHLLEDCSDVQPPQTIEV